MAKRSRTRSRSCSGCMTFALIALIPLCLIVGWVGYSGWNIYQAGLSLQANQEKLQGLVDSAESPTQIDPVQLDNIIREVREDVVTIDGSARPFLPFLPLLGYLPQVGPLERFGPLIADAENYLDLADAATNAASTLRPTLQTALLTAQEDRVVTDNQFAYLITLLQDANPNLTQVEGDIARIESAYAKLESKEALPYSVRQLLPLADEFVPQAGTGLNLAQIAPLMFEGDKLYHVWIQNNDEVRATGGFINGVVVLRISDGDIAEFEYQSSTEINGDYSYLDNVPLPPEPLVNFMNLQYWLTQDASYYPDFPTSAEQGMQLYAIQQPDEPGVDGVIAIDQIFVQKMLTAIGPTYVPALDTEISGDNITQVMRDFFDNPAGLEEGENRLSARRDFIGQMTEALQDRLLSDAETLDLFALGRMGIDAIEARNMQIYLRDATAAATMRELGWDGRLDIRPNQDTLVIVDTNMGYNKVNAVVERDTRYQVQLNASGTHQAQLILTYTHTGGAGDGTCQQFVNYTRDTVYADLFDRCFYNYLRVYPALGTTLNSATPTPVSAESTVTNVAFDGIMRPITDANDQPGFENFLLVPRGSQLTNSIDLTLPSDVVQLVDGSYRYRLTVRKQAGTQPQPVTIQVQLPNGAQLQSSNIENNRFDGNLLTFTQSLERDFDLEIRYTLP